MNQWQKHNLGDVCKLIGGGTPSKSNIDFYHGSIPWATVRDMKDEIITTTDCSITEEAVKKSSTNVIPSGNVVIATRVGLGKVCMIAQDTAINQDLRAIIPNSEKKLLEKFLFWWCKSIAHSIKKEGTGATVQGVKVPFVKSLQIPVPPLEEQKRIVELLDEAFEEIAIAEANTKKNLANARELFDSYLNKVFSQDYKHWEKEKLKNLSSKIGSGATPRGGQKSYKTEGISLIRSLNIHDRKFKKKNLAFIDEEQSQKLSNVIVKNNDVLLNITGASIARCCVVPDHYLPARVNQHVSIIRPNKSRVLPHFLNYLITSKSYKDKLLITGEKAGSTRQALTKIQIQNFVIQYPNIETQSKIINQLDKFEKETTRLERIYQRKLEALAELKQSILQKAFTGQFT